MTVPAWLTVGAEAVIIHKPTHHDRYLTRVTVKSVAQKSFSTVDDDGHVERWNFLTHQRSGGRFRRSLGSWDGDVELVPADDPEVEEVIRERRARILLTRARQAFTSWEANPTDVIRADQLAAAVTAARLAAEAAAQVTR